MTVFPSIADAVIAADKAMQNGWCHSTKINDAYHSVSYGVGIVVEMFSFAGRFVGYV